MSLEIRAGRRSIEISRPDKPLFPCGITKADLARYYEQVAETMLSHILGHPLNLERYPDGIERQAIFQQKAASHFPDWIGRVEVPKKGGTVEHVVADQPATLIYLAGQASITPHAWLSRADRLDRPDRMIFDLDPSEGGSGDVRAAALVIGELLREVGLESRPMTSGSRGYHVMVPLQRRSDFDAVREFSRGVAALAATREPGLFTTEQRKAKREKKILIDVMRNAYAHTAVAPYAVRARPNAPVATPLHWGELSEREIRPDHFTLSDVPARLEQQGDAWRDVASQAQTLTEPRRRLERALQEQGARPA
jgi:bifunctional non-homologous end joining protein LigD